MAPQDRLRVGPTDPGLRLTIGATRLGAAFVGGKVDRGVNALPSAELKLSTPLLAGQPVDYFGRVDVQLAGRTSPQFTGNVVTASPIEDELELLCQTHPGLSERRVGSFESFKADAREVMHLMVRSGGLVEDLLNIEGLDELSFEMVEVLVPLTGVAVQAPIRLGRLSLLRPEETKPFIEPFSDGQARQLFQTADCHALYRRVARRMLDVEVSAFNAIDTVLAWSVARGRYGLTHLPGGEAQRFVRSLALSRPSRSLAVCSRGLDTGRTWLRSLDVTGPDDALPLEPTDDQWAPPPPGSLTVAQRQGLAAFHRAVGTDDVLQRVQALFEAIEFYVAGVRLPHRFEQTDARRIRKSLPTDVPPELRERALHLLQDLNKPPLMVKLREAARMDGVPLTELEWDLLARVRGARNATVHGKASDAPDEEELNHATSVVSRLLLHGIANRPSSG